MGTKGLKIVKFRGRNWIFYNAHDSEPEEFGQSLVDEIPIDTEEYQNWLKSERARFAKWDSVLQKQLCIKPKHLANLETGKSLVDVWNAAAFDKKLDEGPPTYVVPIGWPVSWVYTIDLDLEVFSVDHGAHYRLNKMPGESGGIEALAIDGAGRRWARPQYVSKESTTSLTVDINDFAQGTSNYWNSLEKKKVVPKRMCSTSSKICFKLFDIFRNSQMEILSVTLLGWTAKDLPFREISYFLICLAAGGDNFKLIDNRCIVEPHEGSLYAGIAARRAHGARQLITSVGVGYHMKGLPIGSAPEISKYWFQGALVCLVPRLDRRGILGKAIADAIQYGYSKCNCTSLNALLISIEDVVLIKAYKQGQQVHVEYTGLLPLLSPEIHQSMDARDRYENFDGHFFKGNTDVSEDLDSPVGGQGQANDQDSGHTQKAERVGETKATSGASDLGIEKPQVQSGKKRAGSEEQGQNKRVKGELHAQEQRVNEVQAPKKAREENEDDRAYTDDAQEKPGQSCLVQPPGNRNSDGTNQPAWNVQKTFLSLVQFFEATTTEALKPTDPGTGGLRFPNEIYEMILAQVTDIKTYNACMKVSRRFRSLCHQRPLVMDNILFLEPVKKTEIVENLWRNDDFLAVECSSGRQMGVSIYWGHVIDQSFACRMVVGQERHRKSFAATYPIIIQGLDIPPPKG